MTIYTRTFLEWNGQINPVDSNIGGGRVGNMGWTERWTRTPLNKYSYYWYPYACSMGNGVVLNVSYADTYPTPFPATTPTILTLDAYNADSSRINVDMVGAFTLNGTTGTPTANTVDGPGLICRASGAGSTSANGYVAFVRYVGGVTSLIIGKWVSGAFTQLAAVNTSPAITVGQSYRVRFNVNGSALKGRVWLQGAAEPATWLAATTDSAVAGAGWVGFVTSTNIADNPDYIEALAVASAGEVAPLPTDEATFQLWLQKDGQSRNILIETTCLALDYNTSASTSEYIVCASTAGFNTGPGDFPANFSYEDLVLTVPTYARSLGKDYTGASSISQGDLVLLNRDGVLDSFLRSNWDGRKVKVLIGDPNARRAEYRVVQMGLINDVYGTNDDSQIGFTIGDPMQLFHITPVLKNRFSSADANPGTWWPMALGKCFNVTPKLKVTSGPTYYFTDSAAAQTAFGGGAGTDGVIQVRDNGVSVAYTPTSLADGFTLSAAPSGTITADVWGSRFTGLNPGASVLKVADLAKALTNVMGYTQDQNIPHGFLAGGSSLLQDCQFDTASLTAMNTNCPYTMGLYIADQITVADALDLLFRSVGGFYTFTRDNLFRVGVVGLPGNSTLADMEFLAGDVKEGTLRLKERILPVADRQIGYQKNWTVQATGLAGAVTAANKALYGAANTVSLQAKPSYSGLSDPSKHKLAQQLGNVDSLIALKADADTETLRLYNMTADPIGVFSFVCLDMRALRLQLGQKIKVTHPRWGMAGGRFGFVTGLSDDYQAQEVTIEFLCALDAAQPGLGKDASNPTGNDSFMDFRTQTSPGYLLLEGGGRFKLNTESGDHFLMEQ